MMYDPLNMYGYAMAEQKRNRDRNQNILQRQIFQNAINHHLIQIERGHVVVLDHVGAVNHFNHHPDLFMTIPYNYNYLAHDKDALERTLTQAWQYVNRPI